MENWENKKILVAEDEHSNYMYICALLEESKIQIKHAQNGEKALEFFSNESFDLVFMDLKMPVMDGFEATKEIRKLNNKIPIIAQTAYAFKREECITAGFTNYITKPFNREKILSIIKLYLNA